MRYDVVRGVWRDVKGKRSRRDKRCEFFFSSRRRHTRSSTVSWARRCVEGTDLALTNWQVKTPPPSSLARKGAVSLYTSDAADEQRGVDLGGRRIIKKKIKVVYSYSVYPIIHQYSMQDSHHRHHKSVAYTQLNLPTQYPTYSSTYH